MHKFLLILVIILAYTPLILWVFWDVLKKKPKQKPREFDWGE